MRRVLPVAAPSFVGNEKDYILDCIESTWISSNGKYVTRFEEAFADFCGVKNAVSCSNGTAALHLALLALGIGAGDEVIVPTLTFVATANAVAYCGAKPVFVDSEPETWNLNPGLLEERITPRTKAIIVVHLYGHPVDMDPVLEVAKRHHLYVVEDAAEAHGAQYKGEPVGALGDIATFSFYGNKILTTGEGGMVVTRDSSLADRVRQLHGQGVDPSRRYWFPVLGYNYRMTNIQAAIGLAQLEKADWHLARRREVASWYRETLVETADVILPVEKSWARNVYWMFCVVLEEGVALSRDDVMERLAACGVETRPFFHPVHRLPFYHDPAMEGSCPVADRLGARGINLPTWAGLCREDVDYVCEALFEILAPSGSRPTWK